MNKSHYIIKSERGGELTITAIHNAIVNEFGGGHCKRRSSKGRGSVERMTGLQHRQAAISTATIIRAIQASSPAYKTVFDAVYRLEDALWTKKHSSAASITGINLDVDGDRITVKRLTLTGHKGPYDFAANISIMGALSDPENADALITGLSEYVFCL